MSKTCNNCGEHKNEENKNEESSFAMQLLRGYSKQATRWFAISIIVAVLWFVTIGIFVLYLNQYDVESYTIEQDTTDGGDANFIGNDGDIYNGVSKNNN